MGVYVPAEGPKDARIALFGEAPAEKEVEEGRPFAGPAGSLLETCLTASRLPRHTLYISNFLKERPHNDDLRPWCGIVSKSKAEELRGMGCLVHERTKSWDEGSEIEYTALTEKGMDQRAGMLGEIAGLDARVVIAMGNSSLMGMVGKAGITSMRGSPIIDEAVPGKIILPTIHTAASLRGSYLFRYYIQADLQKAKVMAQPGFELPQRKLITDLGLEETISLLRAYREEPTLGFDIESRKGSLDILAVGFSPHPGEALSIPFFGGRFTTTELSLIRKEIAELMFSPGNLVTQNGIFDTFMIERAWGMEVRRELDDTMIAHRVLYPELLSGLDTLASLYTYEPFYKADGKESKRVGDLKTFLEYNCKDAAVTLEIWINEIRPMLDADPSYRKTYDFVMRLHRPLKKMMHRGMKIEPRKVNDAKVLAVQNIKTMQKALDNKVRPAFEEAAKPIRTKLTAHERALEVLMEKRSKISEKTGRTLKGEEFIHSIEERREMGKAVTVLKREVAFFESEEDEELGGEVLLNVNSQPKLLWYFHGRTGIPPYIKRDTQAPTTDELALQRLAKPVASRPARWRGGFPEAGDVIRVRGRRKMVNTYLNMKMDADNRCRCAYKPLGAKTGRLSSTQTYWGSGGNHQNIPEEFRSVFIPDKGRFLWAVDKKAGEWVIVAYLSGDRNMIKAVEEGIDPHTHTAHLMTGLPHEAIDEEARLVKASTDPAFIEKARERMSPAAKAAFAKAMWVPTGMSCRQAGKKANHGINYNEGPVTFALMNQISEAEARRIIALYTKIAYPGVPRWWESIIFDLRTHRTLENCFGRKWVFRGALNDELFRMAYAFLPQSSLVDAANQGLIYCDRHLPRMETLLQKHDENLGQYKFADSGHFHQDVKRLAGAMTPKMEYGGREFTIGNELALGMSWGGLAEVEMEEGAVAESIAAL